MITVHGYVLKDIANCVVVSVEEGQRIRRKDLESDKTRLGYGSKPYVNPASWSPEEKDFMVGV